MAVASGYWPLIRFNPVLRKKKNPFILDSIRPTIPFEEYAYNELRYRVLKQTQPQDARTFDAIGTRNCGFKMENMKIWLHLELKTSNRLLNLKVEN